MTAPRSAPRMVQISHKAVRIRVMTELIVLVNSSVVPLTRPRALATARATTLAMTPVRQAAKAKTRVTSFATLSWTVIVVSARMAPVIK